MTTFITELRITAIVAILLSSSGWSGSDTGPDQSDYVQHLARGDMYYHRFDVVRALDEYRQSYNVAPDSFAALERMVRVYNDLGRLNLGKSDSSEFFYKKSLAYADSLGVHYPLRAETHFWLALCKGSLVPFLGVRGKLLAAKVVTEEANRAVELDSSFSPAYVVLGILQREAAKIGWFERTIANVIFDAGFSGTLPRSESLLQKAVKIDPSNSYGYYELYRTYTAMSDSARAAEALRTLLALTPTNLREQQQWEMAKRRLARLESHQ
jgi:tetratricopeptide (TPR) repeat protein